MRISTEFVSDWSLISNAALIAGASSVLLLASAYALWRRISQRQPGYEPHEFIQVDPETGVRFYRIPRSVAEEAGSQHSYSRNA